MPFAFPPELVFAFAGIPSFVDEVPGCGSLDDLEVPRNVLQPTRDIRPWPLRIALPRRRFEIGLVPPGRRLQGAILRSEAGRERCGPAVPLPRSPEGTHEAAAARAIRVRSFGFSPDDFRPLERFVPPGSLESTVTRPAGWERNRRSPTANLWPRRRSPPSHCAVDAKFAGKWAAFIAAPKCCCDNAASAVLNVPVRPAR